MKNTQIILFLFSLTVSLVVRAVEISDKGYRNSSEMIIKEYPLMNLRPTTAQLSKYIIRANYKVPPQEADEIAQNILNVSSCFDIDPWVLTALIQKESSFERNAMSPTNAAGLTQFTTIGFKEVNDQLGYRGRQGAPENVTLYFTSKIRGCIDPSWIDLWLRVSIVETDSSFYSLLKEELKKDTLAAITYGAILLKTYIVYVDSKESSEELSRSEIYYEALQIYNGEAGEAKVQYAKNVFKNLQDAYPSPIEFPFL